MKATRIETRFFMVTLQDVVGEIQERVRPSSG
jgi:hypothetical protein